VGHPTIENLTPFAFAPLFIADEEGRPIVVTIVKGTFDVSAEGAVTLAEEQIDIDFAGTPYGDPAKSSYRLEPETAFIKLATDCALLGHAVSPSPRIQMHVSFRVGPVSKTVRVTGDRVFKKGFWGASISSTTRFEKVPLIYERAFGGWDRTAKKEAHHSCEPRNPVGVGFAARHGKLVPDSPLPNVEDPRRPLTKFRGRSTPAGFGFISPDWQPRAQYAGTYDEAWTKNRAPLLPKDFDRRFFQAASPGLVAPGYLRGDEEVEVTGTTPEGRWAFQVPRLAAPQCTVVTRFGADRELTTNLDTVIVDSDARRLILIWRTYTELRSGPHDVSAMTITSANAPAPIVVGASRNTF
jgi:hypothetical protein